MKAHLRLGQAAFAVLMFLAGIWYADVAETERTAEIQSSLQSDQGYRYSAEPPNVPLFPLFYAPFHDPQSGGNVHVLEAGNDLPLPQANLADIADLGKGRFSAWNGTIYFSSSDNSRVIKDADGAANGRYYSVRYRQILAPGFAIVFGVVFAVWLLSIAPQALVARRRLHSAGGHAARLFAGFALLGGALYLGTWRDEPGAPFAQRELAGTALEHTPLSGITVAADPGLSGMDDPRLRRRAGEADLDFAARVTDVVFRSAYDCPSNYGRSALLALHDILWPDSLYEDQGRISVSGGMACTMCSQRSAYAVAAMRRGGLTARPVGLIGHVLVEVDVDDQIFFFDPTVGVGPIPYDPKSDHWLSSAIARYQALPVFQGYGDLLRNAERRIELLSPRTIDERIAFEERLDQVQVIVLYLLLGAGVYLAAGGGIGLWRRRRSGCPGREMDGRSGGEGEEAG